MDNVIEKILEIEDKAQKLVDDATEQKKQISSQIPLEIESIKKNIQLEFEDKLDEKKLQWQEETDKELEAIKLKAAEILEKMDNEANEKLAEWEKVILSKILGR